MNFQRVEAGSGWNWITQGWELFMKNPGIWIVIAIIWFVIAFVLNWIPLIGALVSSLIGPALAGGMIYGARELDEGRSLEIPHLFQAFSDSSRTVPMLLLGLVPLAVTLIQWVILAAVIGGTAATGAVTGSGAAAMTVFAGGALVAFILWLVMTFVVGAALLFGIPLVMFGREEPLPAVQSSFQACLGNIGAFVVFVLIMFLLGIVAVIPFGLGFLLLLPVAMGAMYAAYRQVLGDAGAAAPPQGPVEPVDESPPPAEPEPRDDEPPRV